VRPVYLDYNGTTPVAPDVVRAMLPYFTEEFGNPSTGYPLGQRAKAGMDRAREQVAALIGAESDEIIFTSGGTESNNHVLKGLFYSSDKPFHLVTTRIEHPAIMNPAFFLMTLGADVDFVKVGPSGIVDPDDVQKAMKPHTKLVSVMLANNETGCLQPIADISRMARNHGALLHTDAAQAVGKIAVDVSELGVDFMTMAGHKVYAPKGVGALYMWKGLALEPFMHGAGQESGRRAGTENTALCVGLGAAMESAGRILFEESVRQRALRDRLYDLLKAEHSDIVLAGDPNRRLPNTVNVCFPGLSGSQVLEGAPEVWASTGAACHAGSEKASSVLTAMGLDPEVALGAIRLTVGRDTTRDDVGRAVEALVRSVRALRG
jgi:cysteine desulfurase